MVVSLSIRTNRPGPGRQDGISYGAHVFVVHSIVVLVYLAETLGAWQRPRPIHRRRVYWSCILPRLLVWRPALVRWSLDSDGSEYRRLFSCGRLRFGGQRFREKC